MSYRKLFADQVESFLKQPDAIALDIRDYQSYLSGHLQGAEYADEYCMSKLIRKRKDKPQVLVYCYHGNLSRDFAKLVHNLGIEKVYHLEGGYNSWAQVASA